MKLLITGFFGKSNLGDDIMLNSFCKSLQEQAKNIDITVVVLVGNKHKIFVPEGINIIDISKFKRGKSIIFDAVLSKQYDAFFWIGGTCFTENAGDGSYRYMEAFRKKGKLTGYIGIGIGNIISTEKIKRYKYLLDNASLVTFRDEESYNLARKWSSNESMYLCEDLVYLYDWDKTEDQTTAGHQNNALVSWRCLERYIGYEEEYKAVNEVIKWVIINSEKYDRWTIAVLGDSVDRRVNQYIYEQLGLIPELQGKIDFFDKEDVIDRVKLIEGSDFAILGRLHGIFIAEICNINTIAIGYDNKIERFLLSIEREDDLLYPQEISEVTMNRVFGNIYLDKILLGNKREKSLMNCKLLIEILGGVHKS